MNEIFCLWSVSTFSSIQRTLHDSKVQRMGCTLAVWEGLTELLLAKVKIASCRIGIFIREIL